MKIVFVSNYFNHHQKPFCDEMYKRLGSDFFFISTSEMREERKKLGYSQGVLPSYVHISYENNEKRSCAMKLINEADVVIAGACPNVMLVDRIRSKKLLLRYSERPFKKEMSFAKLVYHAINLRRKNLFSNKVYMLCASAYTASDYTNIGMYKNRMYKWGYFPSIKEYDIETLISNKSRNTILWCGRFIDWKHPDDAIKVASKLKAEGYSFNLNMIGTGVMEKELKQMVADMGLNDVVHFLGSMSPDDVRKHMENAAIYLFTSDRQEGWGAVLNESMNSACAVVASNEIGSVPFLLQNKVNGIVYPFGDNEKLLEEIKNLLDNIDEQTCYGEKAYTTMLSVWNAENAAVRIINLTKALISNREDNLYEDGPCSSAMV